MSLTFRMQGRFIFYKKIVLKPGLIGIFCLFCFYSFAQFPPAAGQPGTTAIYKDSSAFISWATYCSYNPGYVNVSDTNFYYQGSNRTNYGAASDATGAPDNLVISLGDGGSATLGFNMPIKNGPGWDFAVFENGFLDNFLELAFVEVSSDSIHFYRFPCTSLTQDSVQVGTFGTLDPEKINNLAGKYRVYYGTPFDLDTLKNISGLDVNNVRFVRIVDVVGSIQSPYATQDTQGHIINDPWPTPFNTGGFDLDAVGVIHEKEQGIVEKNPGSLRIFPDPCTDVITLSMNRPGKTQFTLYDLQGKTCFGKEIEKFQESIDISVLHAGFYVGIFQFSDGSTQSVKIIKQ
ncbi:MAG: T9SS type A sorting domain-containing protein [Bacteroidota bacterium]|nr:T9SS type A sorting domain-containing protein [Bacteroidota bacterium]